MSFFEVVPDTWLKLNQDETPEYKGKPYPIHRYDSIEFGTCQTS